MPLIEIVSEPDLRGAAEAPPTSTRCAPILVYAGVSECNMEEGSLRCDANVSVRPRGTEAFGTRVEIKNLNSFRHVARAIDHEVARQSALVHSGRPVVQETRLWNAERGETAPMRSKEEAQDYRYFPEPDLPPLVVDDAWRGGGAGGAAGAAGRAAAALRASVRAAGVRRGRADGRARGGRLLRGGGAGRAATPRRRRTGS